MDSLEMLRICTDVYPPRPGSGARAWTALAEDRIVTQQYLMAKNPDRPSRMALLTAKLWAPGQELRVYFMGGDPALRDRVAGMANKWLPYANVILNYVDKPDQSHIRVAFVQGKGSWSYVGRDCLTISKTDMTMNLGWLTAATPDEEVRRVVLHEFGHALGCVHEHESPANGITWDKPKVYEYYERTQGWTKDQVDTNLFTAYGADVTQFTAFDKNSIMLYGVPKELVNGQDLPWNTDLSDTDKAFMARTYPHPQTGP